MATVFVVRPGRTIRLADARVFAPGSKFKVHDAKDLPKDPKPNDVVEDAEIKRLIELEYILPKEEVDKRERAEAKKNAEAAAAAAKAKAEAAKKEADDAEKAAKEVKAEVASAEAEAKKGKGKGKKKDKESNDPPEDFA